MENEQRNEPSTAEIVSALRCSADDDSFCKKCNYGYALGHVFLCDHGRMNENAAARLERLERENADLREAVTNYIALVADLREQKAAETARADAADSRLQDKLGCDYCANLARRWDDEPCSLCNVNNYEYRGAGRSAE